MTCQWCGQEATTTAWGMAICDNCYWIVAESEGGTWDCAMGAESGSEKPIGKKTLE